MKALAFTIARRFAAWSCITLALSGCSGGGGEGGGGGGRAPSTSAPELPGLPTASAIVDVNGDGKNDVVIGVGNRPLETAYSSPILLINEGGGAFRKSTMAIPAQYLGTDSQGIVIEPGDFNKDGKVDLLVVAVDARQATFYQSAQIHLYKGNGDGTFTDASADITSGMWPFAVSCPVFNSSAKVPFNLRVVDIDGDGFLDFIATGSGEGCGGIVYRNDGTGKFAPVNVSLTSGATTVSRPTLAYGSIGTPTAFNNFVADVLVGDLNNDGKVDLFAPSFGSGTHAAFINTSTLGNVSFTVFLTPTGAFVNGVLLDIDGDNKLDVVGTPSVTFSTATAPVVALRGDGTGMFTLDNTLLSPQPAVANARQILAADLNGDGRQDVLISESGFDAPPFPGGRNWLLINNGAGVLVDRTATNLDLLSSYTHQSSIGDLNGDGKPDLILNNTLCRPPGLTCANQERFWLNDGTGKFTPFSPTIH